uniref:Uncharacterized protein n=1 Tax=Fundulus heteroclitus TaxID=8078 RepID=A0A3Q2Q6G1_FUNHE
MFEVFQGSHPSGEVSGCRKAGSSWTLHYVPRHLHGDVVFWSDTREKPFPSHHHRSWRVTYSGGSVMLWLCFSPKSPGNLVKIERKRGGHERAGERGGERDQEKEGGRE